MTPPVIQMSDYRPSRTVFATQELIIDSFAGGGGASTGIEAALGRPVDIAINHNREAILMHEVNHPQTVHFNENIWDVNPRDVCAGRPVGLLWASPDCRHFSKSKGGKPVEKTIRGLAWVVLRWAATVKPRAIFLENVEEFCFTPETTILSKRGVIPIGDIKVGDEVMTHNARWKPVTAVSRRMSETVNISGYGNSIIETTPNHQFYVRQYAPKITVSGKYGRHQIRLLEPEWVRADHLASQKKESTYSKAYTGYAWASPHEFPRYWQRMPEALGVDVESPPFFYMLGRWLGDGWIRKKHQKDTAVRICANKNEAPALELKLKETGMVWTRKDHSESVDVFDLASEKSKILVPWIRHNFGEYAHLKTLPCWIYASTAEQRRALIEGYCDSDGHIRKKGETSTISVSRCLSVGIRLLLHSLGIPASLSKVAARVAPGIGSDKEINYRTAYSVSWRQNNHWMKCQKSELHFFGRVREVKPAQACTEVVDISVADDHSFIADGQVVHNCTWGRLRKDEQGNQYPDPQYKGETFRSFTNALRRQGYEVEYRELRACDYGAPTIRKRLFLIARCDDQPIVWPEATHGDPKSQAVISKRLKPWRTAADCIDFSIPVQSIFGRKKPLAEATMRRIAKGIMRYVVDSADPFIVTYYGSKGPDFRGQPLDEPLRTQTTENRHALVTPVLAPFITEHANASSQRNMPAEEPLRTQCAQVKGGHFALVEAFLAKHYTGVIGSRLENPLGTVTSVDHHSLVTVNLVRHFGKGGGVDISGPHGTVLSKNKDSLITAHMVRHFGQSVGSAPDEPLGTITAGGLGKSGLVTSHLVKLRGSCRDGQQVDTPMPTITSGGQHVGEVRAFLIKYFGTDQDPRLNDPLHTVTTKDRFGLVYVKGEAYEIVDIGMRMLTPRELFSAQGFPETYIIDRDKSGKPVSKTAQVARCGNSVCPPIAEAIVSVNMAEERCGTRRAA